MVLKKIVLFYLQYVFLVRSKFSTKFYKKLLNTKVGLILSLNNNTFIFESLMSISCKLMLW